MSIFKDTFKEGVKSQLKARQEALVERTPSAIQYYNSRAAWIRMTSAVDVGGSSELAKNHVLLGGTLLDKKLRSGIGPSGAYSPKSPGGADHRLGIRPMPGIVSIDVKSKSAYGSLREVVVNFQAWDLRQLEDLELLYMRPGYSVLVEWGWNPYLDNGKTLGNNVEFIDSVLDGGSFTKENVWESIFNKSAINGNYDAVYGFIKNYSWSARADGGYDCSTTLITMGEIIESLKINYGPYVDKPPDKGIFNKLPDSYFAKNTITSKAYAQNIIAGICSELYEIIKQQITSDTTEGTFNGWTFYRFNIDVAGKDENNTIVSEGAQIYITLKDFVDILNKYVLLADTKSTKPVVAVSTFCGKHNGGETTPLTCLGDIQQLSTDPSICQIKNINWATPESSLGISVGSSNLVTIKKIMETLTQDYWYNGDFTTQQLGVIGNIYVNLDYIYTLVTDPNIESQDKKEKNDIALFDFLKTLMSGINTSIGNVANFEIFVDPTDSVARIIDVNYTGNRATDWENAAIIELQKLGSIVRSYKLESQIFPEQSTQIAIGAQVQGGALSEDVNTLIDFNQNLTDRIIPKKEAPPIPKPAKAPDDTAEKEKIRKENLSVIIEYISKIDPDFWEFKGDFDANEASAYSNALKDLISSYKSNVKTDNKNRAIIPTKLSIEMDGIGGIVIGNIFRIPDEILPRGYKGGGAGPSKIGYIVTGLGHSVQNNDWVTKIDSQFIILDEPKGGISTADAKTIKAENKAASSNSSNAKKTSNDAAKKAKAASKPSSGRSQTPNSIVLHHTVGFGSAQSVVDYLPTKGLSIHYAVDRAGGVAQGVDENKSGAHANAKNARSVGIEIVSIGGLTLKDGKYIYGKGNVYKGSSANVVDLGYTYNGYRYYEDITDAQANALTTLLKGILSRNPEIEINYTKSYESIYQNVFGLPGIPVKDKKYNTIKPNGGKGTTGADPGIFIHATAKGGTHSDTFPSVKMLNVLRSVI